MPTDWILQNFGDEYKVILVGDALMDMYELMEKRYDYRTGEAKWSGLDQIKRFREHYDHLIWLNPRSPALGRLLGRELRLYPGSGGHVPADRRRSRARHEKAAREPVKE